jgi:hypothetical protein
MSALPDPNLLIQSLDALPTRKVVWLWRGRLGRGKLAIFDGDPGLGKSLVTLDLCAPPSSLPLVFNLQSAISNLQSLQRRIPAMARSINFRQILKKIRQLSGKMHSMILTGRHPPEGSRSFGQRRIGAKMPTPRWTMSRSAIHVGGEQAAAQESLMGELVGQRASRASSRASCDWATRMVVRP